MSLLAPDFCGHWKTTMLAELTGEKHALAYLVRLWCHCHARMEDRFEMSAKELAALCHYPVADAKKLESALIECRWIERKKKHLTIIGWKEHNKGLFASRENGKRGGRSPKPVKPGNPSDTRGQPTGNPLDTDGLPIGNPSVTHRKPTGNPSVTHGQPRQNREERRGEDNPPTVPRGGTESADFGSTPEQTVQFAIDHLTAIFDRAQKRMGAGARHFLESMAMQGALPLPDDDWQALRVFYAQRGEHPQEKMWRNSPERIAEDLLGEIDKAKTWLTTHGIDFGATKSAAVEGPEPEGWREWLGATFPLAEVPAKFSDLPEPVQTTFLDRKRRTEAKEEAI